MVRLCSELRSRQMRNGERELGHASLVEEARYLHRNLFGDSDGLCQYRKLQQYAGSFIHFFCGHRRLASETIQFIQWIAISNRLRVPHGETSAPTLRTILSWTLCR